MHIKREVGKKFLRLLSLRSNVKLLFIFNFLISIFIFDLSKAEGNNETFKNIDQSDISYLESKKELEDYIIDTGDRLYIEFDPLTGFTNDYGVSQEGEIFLPRIEETYVRGLTPYELEKLLKKRYLEFLVDPEIKVRISQFKSMRVLVKGEVRNPGLYKFPLYKSNFFIQSESYANSESVQKEITNNVGQIKTDKSVQSGNQLSENKTVNIKRTNQNITTISDVIRQAGGITSFTDLSRIEIIRDVPLGKGGGKKIALIDLNSFLNESDDSNDLRVFDGDILILPKLSMANRKQIPKSVLGGLSPRFISVNVFGRVENGGTIKLPLESTLSDVIDLTGPIKPLSGKIVLIRYELDGQVIKKNISYSASAKRGSKKNPFIKEGDLISVKNSFFGKSTGVLAEITTPFVQIYTTKTIFDSFK